MNKKLFLKIHKYFHEIKLKLRLIQVNEEWDW